MRKVTNLNDGWLFKKNTSNIADSFSDAEKVNVPHNWNGKDGQDGKNDYFRGHSLYKKVLGEIKLAKDEEAYLEFKAVNTIAIVYLNGEKVGYHEGGYSAFRINITDHIKGKNELIVDVDNGIYDNIYPQKADFTFYGGIYRDVNLIIVSKNHFDLLCYGSLGVKIDTFLIGTNGRVDVTPYIVGEGDVVATLCDHEGNKVAEAPAGEPLVVQNVHPWGGLRDPYLYNITITLNVKGKVVDEVKKKIGFRNFKVDPKKGFYLNDEKYPLRGVCRHQDYRDLGNSLTKAEHKHDLELIKEVGANTIRLAHYQHDDYVYDLCDEMGFVIWAEIPYISRHHDSADKSAIDQMTELVYQAYHHPSIVCWGVSNEITMFGGHQKELCILNKKLHDLCHEMDPYRLTTMACFAMCGPFNKVATITDIVSWNFYYGWYTPFKWLNYVWFDFYHLTHRKRCVGLSEYGAEAMLNLHSIHPHRGDSTEEYQNIYHEYMLRFFDKKEYLWATHVWNMFDFGSDGRNQGGEPGINHKGLVCFDHKTKKDSFYLYKAWWTNEEFVHICGKRFENRTGKKLKIKVYSPLEEVSLYGLSIAQYIKRSLAAITPQP